MIYSSSEKPNSSSTPGSYTENAFRCAKSWSRALKRLTNAFFCFRDNPAMSSAVCARLRIVFNDVEKDIFTSSQSSAMGLPSPPREYKLIASLYSFGDWNVTICPYCFFSSNNLFVRENAWMMFCKAIGCLSINKIERHGASNPVKSLSTTITRSSCWLRSIYFFSFLASRSLRLLL